LRGDNQLDASEEAAFRWIDLIPSKGQEIQVCQSHRFLGNVYHSKNEREKAIHHFEISLKIASDFKWGDQLFWINRSLAQLFLSEQRLDDANTHIERAKSYVGENAYNLGRATEVQARIWFRQGRLEDAISETSRAIEICEKLGAVRDASRCKSLLEGIKQALAGEPPRVKLFPVSTDSLSQARGS
jgi:tetratricopeptide (TPR) repeat protein